jgi:cobalt/nickel transport system permease protein
MHMADALLSPQVAGVMWGVSATAIACCSAKVGRELDDRKVPLMGVLGAFLFAAQMINFSIPGTGSSGHLGGGLLLAALLGPCAAFLTVASVLVVQALFFADGGLLALGCNIFNMGFIPAFLVFPFFYRPLIGAAPSRTRLAAVTIGAAVLGLQLGPLAVVLETVLSGISSLPFATFVLLMQPVHLAIGLVEGAVTVAVLSFVRAARPELLQHAFLPAAGAIRPLRGLLAGFLLLALALAGCVSIFASKDPDGLEWAIARITGHTELTTPAQGIHAAAAGLQQRTAWFPDYSFGTPAAATAGSATAGAGTGLAGVIGALLTLLLALGLGLLLKRSRRRAR